MIEDDLPKWFRIDDLAFLIDRCSQLLNKRYDNRLSAAKLSATEFNVLVALGIIGKCSREVLRGALTIDALSLDPCLSRLEAAELIVGSADGDGSIQLTAAARSLILTAEPLWQAAQADANRALGADAASRLADVLAKLEALASDRKP